MRCVAVIGIRAFHQRLRQRRVRVDGQCDVFDRRAHFHRQHGLGDKFARARARDAHAEHAVGFGINNDFRHAVRVVKCQRAA